MTTLPTALDQLARAGIRRVPWRTVLATSVGVSSISLLTVAGVMPIARALAAGTLTLDIVCSWLDEFGPNALAG
jgi:hypothetical protein